MARKIPASYQAADGTEFDTLEEAEQHDLFIAANQELERALAGFNRVVAEQHKMGDGRPFKCKWGRFWYLTAPLYDMPRLMELSLSFNSSPEFEIMGNGKLRAGIKHYYDSGNKEQVEWFKVERLFEDEKAAHAALLHAQAKWLEERRIEVGHIRANTVERWPDLANAGTTKSEREGA